MGGGVRLRGTVAELPVMALLTGPSLFDVALIWRRKRLCTCKSFDEHPIRVRGLRRGESVRWISLQAVVS